MRSRLFLSSSSPLAGEVARSAGGGTVFPEPEPLHPHPSFAPRGAKSTFPARGKEETHKDPQTMTDPTNWDSIRTRYEQGEELVTDIAASIGLTQIVLSKKAKALGWILRGVATKRSKKSESTRATLKRLKDLLQSRVTNLEREINEIGKDVDALTSERDIRSMNTLVRTLDKVLELERKDRNSRIRTNNEYKRFSDEERGALADKLERLQRQYAAEETEQGSAAQGNGGAE